MKKLLYLGALYLESKSQDPKKIIESDETKYVIMHFQRDLSAKKLKAGIVKGFEENKVDQQQYAKEIAKLFSVITDSSEGQEISITFSSAGVSMSTKGSMVFIENAKFGKELMKLWLQSPPNKELKQGMLGKVSE